MKTTLSLYSLLATFFLFTVSMTAQETETRNLDDFSGISVSSGIDATLVKGNTNKIEISAKGIELDKISTTIKGDRLKVGVEKNNWKFWSNKKRKVEVTITYDSTLDYIASTSGSDVHADHTITARDLGLASTSGANLDLDIEANEVDIDVSSGARMDLAGNSKKVKVDISSGATLDASDLESASVDVDGSSGSSVKVHATNSLTVDVSSGASVKYKGNPTTDIDKSSGGSVRKI